MIMQIIGMIILESEWMSFVQLTMSIKTVERKLRRAGKHSCSFHYLKKLPTLIWYCILEILLIINLRHSNIEDLPDHISESDRLQILAKLRSLTKIEGYKKYAA